MTSVVVMVRSVEATVGAVEEGKIFILLKELKKI
jgi:hypothetical protein